MSCDRNEPRRVPLLKLLCLCAVLSASHALAAQQVEPEVPEQATEPEQEVPETEIEAPETTDNVVEQVTNIDVSPTYIVSASGRFLSAYPVETWLDPELEICLEEGEVVQLARPESRIASMELRGPLCTIVAQAADAATIVVETNPGRRARTGAVRGSGRTARGSGSSRFLVAAGSPGVLDRFPRGSVVTTQSEICLEQGEQVTLLSSRGQRVTYRGPGCARRNTQPSATNLGGFTFGWNGTGSQSGVVALP